MAYDGILLEQSLETMNNLHLSDKVCTDSHLRDFLNFTLEIR